QKSQSEPGNPGIIANLPYRQPDDIAFGERCVESPRRDVPQNAKDRAVVMSPRENERIPPTVWVSVLPVEEGAARRQHMACLPVLVEESDNVFDVLGPAAIDAGAHVSPISWFRSARDDSSPDSLGDVDYAAFKNLVLPTTQWVNGR